MIAVDVSIAEVAASGNRVLKARVLDGINDTGVDCLLFLCFQIPDGENIVFGVN